MFITEVNRHGNLNTHTHTHTYIYIYIYTYIHIFIYIYIFIYIHQYIYIYIMQFSQAEVVSLLLYVLYTHIHADVSRKKMTTSVNERRHFFIKKYTSHTLFSKRLRKGCERVDDDYVWEVSWRRGQTATYWPKVLLVTIAALLLHLGWAAQLWIAEGRKPPVWRWFWLRGHPISYCDWNWTASDPSRLWHLVM